MGVVGHAAECQDEDHPQRRRQKCTATVLLAEKRRPLSTLHVSRRVTASYSCWDTRRGLETEYETARSSTKRDQPTDVGISSLISLIKPEKESL